uniref:Beta-1,3-N-acetylglucosaminyltransferase lunatic fringe-like n=1 Tax=Hippocampus comes TaxID=109280 RepID=A0A3Q2YXL6_HIPCM
FLLCLFVLLLRKRRAVGRPAPSGAPPKPAELLTADDVFVSVKTTSKYHRGRLELLLDTWIANDFTHWFSPTVRKLTSVAQICCWTIQSAPKTECWRVGGHGAPMLAAFRNEWEGSTLRLSEPTRSQSRAQASE